MKKKSLIVRWKGSIKHWLKTLYWKIFVEPALTDDEIGSGYDLLVEEEYDKRDMRK